MLKSISILVLIFFQKFLVNIEMNIDFFKILSSIYPLFVCIINILNIPTRHTAATIFVRHYPIRWTRLVLWLWHSCIQSSWAARF